MEWVTDLYFWLANAPVFVQVTAGIFLGGIGLFVVYFIIAVIVGGLTK